MLAYNRGLLHTTATFFKKKIDLPTAKDGIVIGRYCHLDQSYASNLEQFESAILGKEFRIVKVKGRSSAVYYTMINLMLATLLLTLTARGSTLVVSI